LAACTELTTVADLETFLSAAESFAGVPHSATLKARPTALPAWISAGKAVDIAAHSEVETVRYYTALARKNFGMDDGFYPLGSCTMKYNPKVSEEIVAAEAWTDLHPAQREDETQGALQVMFELEQCLKEVTGCHALTLQPAAGAQGELTALLMARRYFLDRGETARVNVIVPDSSHGTNPASASMAGFNTVSIPTDPRGNIDVAALKAKVGPDTAVLMLTNPSTLGCSRRTSSRSRRSCMRRAVCSITTAPT
jgi:glycine dehydrogenase subunit 2